MWDWIQNSWSYISSIDTVQVNEWLHHYASLGPILGVLLPLTEALFPVLPLMAFIIGNAAAYGFWFGLLWSWIGVSCGAILVFWVVRQFSSRFGSTLQLKFKNLNRFYLAIEQKGFSIIFLLFAMPFLPSSLILFTAGLSKVRFSSFIIPALAGRTVLVFALSYVGYDWQTFIHQPWRIALLLLITSALWLGARKLSQQLHCSSSTACKGQAMNNRSAAAYKHH